MPNWGVALALTAVLAAGLGWLLAHWPVGRTWPALILIAYIVYPEADLALALFIIAVAAVTAAEVALHAAQFQAARPVQIASAIALAAAFFGLYVRTLAPDVLPADSGELQVVAANLGVAHPPGFPLYVMLGHLWTLLPLGPGPAYRLNLFSAATSALALLMVYLTATRLAGRRPLLSGWTAALALGTATTYWAQATTANVRSLTGLFTALTLYCLIRFGQATRAHDGTAASAGADRWLILTALALGFGVTHHTSLVFLAMIALLYVLLADRTLWRMPRRWLWPAVAALAGLLPLLYLPLRANSGARGASPQLATVSGFFEHVLAIGFRGDLFYFTDPAMFWERLRVMGDILTFQYTPVLLLGMALGLVLLILRERLLALLLGGTAAIFTVVAATYRAPQTVDYMLPAYVALALCLAYAVGNVPTAAREPRSLALAAGQMLSALWLVSAVNQGWQHYSSFAFLHSDTTARNVAGGWLEAAPTSSEILAHWHWVTPLWYLQEVEGLRPDVTSRFVFPEGESYADTWANRVQQAVASGQPVIASFYDPLNTLDLPVPQPLGEAYLFQTQPLTALPPDFEPVAVILGGQIAIAGYRQEATAVEAGEALVLTLAWRPVATLPDGLSLFAHLIGTEGQVYGQDDVAATYQEDGLTLTQFRIVPRPGTPLGTLVLAVGAYGSDVLLDEAGAARVPLSNVIIEPGAFRPFTQQPLARQELSAAERQLVGYDWDYTVPDRPRLYLHWRTPDGYSTEVRDSEFEAAGELYDLAPYRGPWGVPVAFWRLPSYPGARHYVPFGSGITWSGEPLVAGRYAAGETLTLDQRLHANQPVLRDYVVSTRLIGLEPDGQRWSWWDLEDAIPGLGAVPTLKWIHGSDVLTPHLVTVDPAAPDGQQLTGALTIYDAFTNRPLPILDERLTANSPWVPLGNAQVGD